MSEENSSSTDENEYTSFLTNNIKFWSYFIVLIPSIVASLFNLYHLLFDRTLRRTLNNHVIIVVLLIGLFCQITIYPWMLYYYHVEGVWDRSFVFCTLWTFIDYVYYVAHTLVFAWATIERHILIFHDQWVSTRNKRIFVHYLPIIILLLYCFVFYFVLYLFPSCNNIFDNNYIRCTYFCIYDKYTYFAWETIAHQLIPGFIILVCSIGLLVRILWRKIRIHRTIQWQKYRKMAVQLLSISSVYFLFYFPYVGLSFMYLYVSYYDLNPYVVDFLNYYSYFLILFFPFVCTLVLPDLSKRIRTTLRCGRPSRAIGIIIDRTIN